MLKQLRIQNIILIESAEINFQPGFNVISGETGAGKSAILEALGLIIGERADSSILRRGADKGVIEARFDVESVPELLFLLADAGIDHHAGEDLIIRREINASGKSRAFLNHQMAQVSLLRQIGSRLVSMSGQHANQKLLSTEHHRMMVDLYGEINEEAHLFAQSWDKEQVIQQQIETILNNERLRVREIEMLRLELDELENANLKEQEEEALFNEYTTLVNVEELMKKAQDISQVLQGEEKGVLGRLSKYQHSFDQLTSIDPKLTETAEAYRNAVIELTEVAYSLQNYANRLEHNPQRTGQVNERLSLINKLKRKYGNSIPEILAYKVQIESKLTSLESAEEQVEILKNELEILAEVNNALSSKLTQKRKEISEKLNNEMTEQLVSLNMPKAEFQIKIIEQKRSRHGNEAIEFYLTPNRGEHLIPIKDCASGGELSRLMLALQTLMAGKEKMPTIVFDEIDANIGGATASVVGKKLKEIGTKHQILCITHFPQVAKYGEHHFEISKQEVEGRTLTLVNLLDASSKKRELSRMQGKA
jgi:DNA repair protein RecN (Recombination protein N)